MKNERRLIDFSQALMTEQPSAVRAGQLLEARIAITNEIKALEEQRKRADEELLNIMQYYDVEEIKVNHIKAVRVVSRSGGRWNKLVLEKYLTPQQIEEAFIPGNEYEYVRIEEGG